MIGRKDGDDIIQLGRGAGNNLMKHGEDIGEK
jgi:hypothetical protein